MSRTQLSIHLCLAFALTVSAACGGCDDAADNSKTSAAADMAVSDVTARDVPVNVAQGDAGSSDAGIVDAGNPNDCTENGSAQVFTVQRASYAVDACGRLWGWGEAVVTSPALDTPLVQPAAVRIAPRGDWREFSPGRTSACGIQADGSLWCWGIGSTGELGLGTDIGLAAEPTRVGAESDWHGLERSALLTENVCALRGGGELWCWGSNRDGNLDDASTDPVNSPRRIGTDSDWTAVAVAQGNICGLKPDGSLWCWGDNSAGQLGNGVIGEIGVLHPPSQVAGSWIAVDAVYGSICGIEEGGALKCWGAAGAFHLPQGAMGFNQPDPIEVDPGFSYTDLALPGPLALRDDGALVHYLYPGYGPISTATDWSTVASGLRVGEGNHQCASRATGEVFCRGHNSRGQVGMGTSSTRWEPAQLGSDDSWRELDAEVFSSCAVSDQGPFCWGRSNVDISEGWSTQSPFATAAASEALTKVSTGLFHRCALGTSGALYCIGSHGFGQLGIGEGVFATPGEWMRVGAETDWSDVHVAWERTCGIRSGEHWCWGNGIGYEPVQMGSDADWLDIIADRNGSLFCGLRSGGTIWCHDGAVLRQAGAIGGFESVAVGSVSASLQACGINGAGELWCEAGGQLSRHGSELWRSVALGQLNGFCGVSRAGSIQCVNMSGQYAGRGDPAGSGGATLDDTDWIDLQYGDGHICATKGGNGVSGELYCWGDGFAGQTGTGDAHFDEFQRVSGF